VASTYAGVSGDRYDAYERGRPGWPAEVVEMPGLPSSASVLELGPGTGKLTRLLTARFRSVVTVEPKPSMRRVLAGLCPGAEILHAIAEDIPVPDASFDAVFAAEAFHHFDGKLALAEIARVLHPRGVLMLMWNLPAGPTEPSIADVERLLAERGPKPGEVGYDPIDLNPERYASGEWRRAFEGSPFEELRDERLPNPQVTDREGIVDFLATMGWVEKLTDTERVALLDEVRARLTAAAYRRPWETHVHWTRLHPSPS
jgi:SAM-dependent methyltransferase